MLKIVSLRQIADITALDVANAYKEAYTSGVLINIMEKEIAEHEIQLDDLKNYLEASGSDLVSNERLRLELDHAMNQMTELKTKFSIFKPPVSIAKNMEEVDKQLSDIENSIDDIATVMDSNCELCLLHIKQLQKQIDVISDDCSKLESEKDLIIRKALFGEQEAVNATSRISELQSRCLKISQRSASTVERLSRASQLLQKFNDELTTVDQLILKAESTKTTDVKKASNLVFCSCVKEGIKTLARARELKQLLRQDSVQISKEKVEKLTENDKKLLELERLLKSEFELSPAADEQMDLKGLVSRYHLLCAINCQWFQNPSKQKRRAQMEMVLP
jgi:hypothetical protein